MGEYRPGDKVELHGLVKMLELNGQQGQVICRQNDRFVIRLPEGDHAIKAANCKPVGTPITSTTTTTTQDHHKDRHDRDRRSHHNDTSRHRERDHRERDHREHREHRGDRDGRREGERSSRGRDGGRERRDLRGFTLDPGADAKSSNTATPAPTPTPTPTPTPSAPIAAQTPDMAAVLGAANNNPAQMQQIAAMSVLMQHMQQQEIMQRQQQFTTILNTLMGQPQLMSNLGMGLQGQPIQGGHIQHHHHHHNHNHNQQQQQQQHHHQQQPHQERNQRRRRDDEVSRPEGCVVLVVMRGGVGVGLLDSGMFEMADLDQVYWIFSQFGQVEKASLFLRDEYVQALIQYATPDAACMCRAHLNGKSVWTGVGGPAKASDAPVLAVMQSAHKELSFPKPDIRNREYAGRNADLDQMIRQSDARTTQSNPNRTIGDSTTRQDMEAAGYTGVRGFLWGRPVSWGTGFFDPPQPESERWQLPKGEATQGKVGDCVLISHLPSNDWPASKLWGLVGVYGEVSHPFLAFFFKLFRMCPHFFTHSVWPQGDFLCFHPWLASWVLRCLQQDIIFFTNNCKSH